MRNEGAKGRLRVSAWVLVLGVLLSGMGVQAQTQSTTTAVKVTTPALTGDSGDTVVASMVDTGVRTGASVRVTLRLVDVAGAIVAETTGLVSEGVPLRLYFRATSTAGLSAQVILPLNEGPLSAPVLTIERWTPGVLTNPTYFTCTLDGEPPPGPVTSECPKEPVR